MKGSSQGDTANCNNNHNNVDGGSADDDNNTEEGEQQLQRQIIEEKNDNDNNDDNIEEEEEEEEEPETQESFTQHEMTQTGNELTQMGLFDDDDDIDNCNGDDDGDDQDGNDNSRQPMIDPLTLPWGRLMPVGSNEPSPNANTTSTTFADMNGTASSAAYTAGPLNNNAATTAAATTTSIRPSTREAIEMLPKSPETKTITRSSGQPAAAEATNNNTNYSQDEGITFLGLKNLVCSDRFNEYVLGRSVKVRHNTTYNLTPLFFFFEYNKKTVF